MNYLPYTLYNDVYLNRFLVSALRAEQISGEPVKIETDANVWEGSTGSATHRNPIRDQFIEKRRKNPDVFPHFTSKDVDGEVVYDNGQSYPMSVRFPFSDPVVALSGFWSTPTWISSTAFSLLQVPKACTVECEFTVCGGASLWINGKLVTKHDPYERNQSIRTTIAMDLLAGDNELVVSWDEFAERDSECSFSLKMLEAQPEFIQKIPVGERDTSVILAVEHALGDLCCTSNHVRHGEVLLHCSNPYQDKALVISMKGATEENYMAGDLYETQAVFAPGSTTASLGPCETLPIGYLQFVTTTEVQGMKLSYHLAFENFPLSLLPRPAATMDERKKQAFAFLAKYGERNGNRAVAILHAGGDRTEFEMLLRRQITFINNRSDCSDFYLPYFPHMLRMFATHPYLTEDLQQAMKQCIINFRYWHDEPGDDVMWFYSENHALMFHVCQLLCGELYPQEVFTNSGMTGQEMQQKALKLLDEWFEVFFSIGFTEWNSPPYLPIDELGFASLYAQTENQRMKALAKRGLEYLSYILSVYSLDGIFSTTAGRTYHKELFGNNSNCPSFINWIERGIGNPSHAGKGVTSLCFSEYQAPEQYRKFATVPKGKALLSQSTHGYQGHADVYAYKTSTYLLSSANNFRVGERGFQENPIHLLFGSTEQLWVSHPGEHTIFGHARPSYWAGNGTLPRVNQYQGFASIIYHINAEHPVGFTHLYLPTMEFSSWKQEGNWIFAEATNGGYAALYCSNPLVMQTYGPTKGREFVSEGRTAVYLMRAGSKSSFGSFSEFIRVILASALTCSKDSFAFTDIHLGLLSGSWTKSLEVDGSAITYKGFTPIGENLWVEER